MSFSMIDAAVFVAFVISVITLGMVKSRHEKSGEDYFLAGRGLKWWLIGFSLIAANISTEQFVGMSGNAASHLGLAIASYEWMAAITLVVVAFFFLPYFLRAGIYTMPEFLEYRYNGAARTIMALATIMIYMILLGAVTYSGALTISDLAAQRGYTISLQYGALAIGLIAGLYVFAGGLKACAWADLIQGAALILGGGVILYFAFDKLSFVDQAAYVTDVKTGAVAIKELAQDSGSLQRFWDLNKVRMNMFLPATDSVLPYTALIIGLWIPNFYYWGLNQYITQRTLGSSSLAQGQKGIVFAAFMKLLIPFVIVVPGIIAFNLFFDDMRLASVSDNAAVMAQYHKANPQTQLVQVTQSPSEEQITQWPDGRFMIAVYESEQAMKDVKERNAFVLPITAEHYESLEMAPYTMFASDDLAWTSVFPALAVELDVYNKATEAAAKKAGQPTSTQKFIAYKYDTALAQILGKVLPQGVGLFGFVLAALLGAVVSSLAAMLNAASTIFTMDIYKKYLHPAATDHGLMTLGRVCVAVFTVVAILLAPQLGNPNLRNSIFTIIQESQGFISPGVLAVFAFGLLIRRAPAAVGAVGLLTNALAYLMFMLYMPQINFLNRMAWCFLTCIVVMTIITLIKPLAQPVEFKKNTTIELTTSSGAKAAGILVVILTLVLYLLFSPWGLLR